MDPKARGEEQAGISAQEEWQKEFEAEGGSAKNATESDREAAADLAGQLTHDEEEKIRQVLGHLETVKAQWEVRWKSVMKSSAWLAVLGALGWNGVGISLEGSLFVLTISGLEIEESQRTLGVVVMLWWAKTLGQAVHALAYREAETVLQASWRWAKGGRAAGRRWVLMKGAGVAAQILCVVGALILGLAGAIKAIW